MSLSYEDGSMSMVNNWHYFMEKRGCTVPTKDDPLIDISPPLLPGEYVRFIGRSREGIIALTSYRLLLFGQLENEYRVNTPVRMLDAVIGTELFVVLVHTKDMGAIRLNFATNDVASVWRTRLADALAPSPAHDDICAFHFKAFLDKPEFKTFQKVFDRRSVNKGRPTENGFNIDGESNGHADPPGRSLTWKRLDEVQDLRSEFERMDFSPCIWRISDINCGYEVCKTYPEAHIVPERFSNAQLHDASHYRAAARFPSVTWRSTRTGAVIARCSQPGTGIFSTRNTNDEQLLEAIANACRADRPPQPVQAAVNAAGRPISMNLEDDADPGMLIVDARSYSAAFANRARGYGSEMADYYTNCRVEFGNLANIHAVRTAFDAMRTAAHSVPAADFQLATSNSRWFTYIAQLLQCSRIMVDKVEQGCPVVVHCSDGWDRTPQLTALAQVCLDKHYRTIKGIQRLIEREWLAFGHKFADRCGHDTLPHKAANTERSPIFIQWLDAIYQIMCQFPNAFEYNSYFLVKLATHVNSCLFGDFLFNSSRERADTCTMTRTCSVWDFLDPSVNWRILNLLYNENAGGPEVLRPSYVTRDMRLWSDLYATHWPPCESGELPPVETANGNQNRAAAAAAAVAEADPEEAAPEQSPNEDDEGAPANHKNAEEVPPLRVRETGEDNGLLGATSADFFGSPSGGMISSTDTVVMQPTGSPGTNVDSAPSHSSNGGGLHSVPSANSMTNMQLSWLGASSNSIEALDPGLEMFTNVERHLQVQAASLVKSRQTENGSSSPDVNGLSAPPAAFGGLDWDALPLPGVSEGLVVRSILLHYERQLDVQRTRREHYQQRALNTEKDNERLRHDVTDLKQQLQHLRRQLNSRQEECPATLPVTQLDN